MGVDQCVAGPVFKHKLPKQDFAALKAKCLKAKTLFEDPTFLCTNTNVSATPEKLFEWKRPHDLCKDPKFVVGTATRFDVDQGELGDCWFLAAAACLTMNKQKFARVVPTDQSFGSDYAGIFHFRFWQYGQWVDVVIDDRLPCRYDSLSFVHSLNQNEFWSALLEKAFAKLQGSYIKLEGGNTMDALEDFTGGVTETYPIAHGPKNLFQVMMKAYERSSFMGCSGISENIDSKGLIGGHAYSITAVAEITTTKGKVRIVRVRNPWGNEAEWKGAWSDNSAEWKTVPEKEKERIGLKFKPDGEFWMSFEDWKTYWEWIEICHLGPGALDETITQGSEAKKFWATKSFEGSWTKNCTAGGCRDDLKLFATNPQYRIVLEQIDDDDDEEVCTIIIALMQKYKRKIGAANSRIGFDVYNVENKKEVPRPLSMDFFEKWEPEEEEGTLNVRELSARHRLPPGTYCIIPFTQDPNDEGDFLIRVFAEKQHNMHEYDDDVDLHPQPEDKQSDEKNTSMLRDFFANLAGENMGIDCHELQTILNIALRSELEYDGFSTDVCRSMIATMDTDQSGSLEFEEFLTLWTNIRAWKKVFKKFDKYKAGYLSTIELRAALISAGYGVNNKLLKILVLRYGKNGKLNFDEFIMCAVKLKTMIENFTAKVDNKGQANFTMDEWIENTMYS